MTQETVTRGRELFHGLAACGFCHGQKAEPNSVPVGGRPSFDIYGEVLAPNLTPAQSALGKWEAKDLLTLFRSGVARNRGLISPEVHRGSEWISDRDLLSLTAYMRSLPAVENKVERRSVGFVDRYTTGILEGRKRISGYVPTIDRKHELEYGRYLVDNIARCTACHSTPATLVSASSYLAGGKTVKVAAGEKVAPGITSSQSFGLGSWSESEIVKYLQGGMTPDNKRSDPALRRWSGAPGIETASHPRPAENIRHEDTHLKFKLTSLLLLIS